MPAAPDWDVWLRGGVQRALSQRGCSRGRTVSNFRGRARLHLAARAAGGHRKQPLLPYPWESAQLEAIRDGVVLIYEEFQKGIPPEEAINALASTQGPGPMQPPSPSSPSDTQLPEAPPAASDGRALSVDWAELIQRYQAHKLRSGEIKETTWERLYKPRMALLLKTLKGHPRPRDAT